MNPYDYFDSIFCINLDSRPDRWEQAKEEFSKARILDRVQRFSAIEIKDNPAKGNHLSHAQCLRLAKESGAKNCLIFEDDIEWLENPFLMRMVIPELNNWDLLYLGVNTERPHEQIDYHLSKLNFAYSTHAYAINSNMFDILIELNERENLIHNDVVYSEEIIPNYNCYATIPLLAGQRKSYSNIMKKEMDSNPIFKERFYGLLVSKYFPVSEPTFVTFITPTMGRNTLRRTVDSIINQEDWDWKAVVIFDGRDINYSTDNDHVKVIKTELKGHAGLVRNEGLKLVSTNWIAFVDDDDWLDSDYVQSIKRWTGSNPEADLIVFTYRDVTNGNTQPPKDLNVLQFGNVGISFAVKTDFLIQHNIEFRDRQCEDWVFIEECLNNGAKFVMTHEIKYRVGGRGQWRF